ncbi:zinc finger domain-containing protein, LSD1 subclass [Flavobacterium fryxellicola]|uniref:Uncharacterized protein n=1 Tax=Flavobacterium fryxellicola TaxID=249352 RepID=A0A167XPH8_9FLAO|nr:hypothetical protein [Flavobacterium fryxellicola]OAB28568.1 hypothetical protein FBFR_07690 [Flavobacterium fryxellicola]SHN51944.1 zinc finger domain-containing protein, LSD1 subclass [Flavobacterium fryxellicola]
MNKSYIKCSECNTVNLNQEYCSNCGAILDVVLKRKLESESKIQEKIEQQKNIKPNKVEAFLTNGLEHSNLIIRFFFKAGYAIWLFFAVLVGGIVALVTAAAAG